MIEKVLYGTGSRKLSVRYPGKNGRYRVYDVPFEGVIPNLRRRYESTQSDWVREEIERYMAARPCPTCKGARLKPEVLAVTVADANIVEISSLPIRRALDWGRKLAIEPGEEGAILSVRDATIARQILKEIGERLGFLIDVGLDYLTLERATNTLSGGEAQRIRLATQIGSSLMGVLYILDEPSIGLHQRDNERLIKTLVRLRDIGNTLIVVEHDEDMMRHSDWIIDVGPGAGEHGGHIVATGSMDDIARVPDSITGQFLSGTRKIEIPPTRREGNGRSSPCTAPKATTSKTSPSTFRWANSSPSPAFPARERARSLPTRFTGDSRSNCTARRHCLRRTRTSPVSNTSTR
ncbi:MAG: hypothetical protein R2845_06200 [Thermomicrobiales bacterium]